VQPKSPSPWEDAETIGLLREENESYERLPSDLSARQRHADSGVVRLQALENRELNYSIPNYDNIVMQVGDILASVTRHIRLEIKQHCVETISKLVRRTSLNYRQVE
jgi:hypothetical protein